MLTVRLQWKRGSIRSSPRIVRRSSSTATGGRKMVPTGVGHGWKTQSAKKRSVIDAKMEMEVIPEQGRP